MEEGKGESEDKQADKEEGATIDVADEEDDKGEAESDKSRKGGLHHK
jgi:hypothetical protein